MNKKLALALVMLGFAIVACQCGVSATGVYFSWSDAPTVCTNCSNAASTPAAETAQSTEQTAEVNTPKPEEKPLIDQFGPEQVLPSTVTGPAIAEVYDPKSGYCALVKVNESESLPWSGKGAFWQAASQAALVARFPHHSGEYKQNYPNCKIVLSANDVPNPTQP